MLLLALLACHGDKPLPETGTPDTPPVFTDPDGATLQVGEDGVLSWADPRGGARTVQLSFGTVSSPDPTVNYDPWYLYDDPYDAVPSGLGWQAVSRATWAGEDFVLELADGSAARLVVDDRGPGLRIHVAQEGAEGLGAPYVRAVVSVGPDERFYGMGEVFGTVQHRGTVQAMQFELRPDLESANNEVHVPVPLLVSSASWGLLADSFRPGTFDLAATNEAEVVVTFNQDAAAPDAGLALDLYAPPTPTEVTARYHARQGPPEVPPTWAFAPLQWRNEVSGSADVRADLAAIRANDVATGTIWVDNPWQTTYNSMQPDPAMFPDWDELVAELHGAGFRVMAWTTPYLEPDDPEHDAYADAGWFVDAPLLFNGFGDWVDLTADAPYVAWRTRAEAARDRGIEGWKLDYGEDAQLGVGAARLPYGFANGEDERTLHHQINLYYHAPYADAYPDLEGFLLGRGGSLRGHTITDCIWPGDLDSDFTRFGEGDHVGGLPSAIRAGTGLSVSGYHFFASDIGGFRNNRPDHETMVRWTEYAALLPIMQYGGGGENHNPWDFTAYDDSQFNEDTLSFFKKYAQLHTQLFPYFWELASRAEAEGLPILRSPGLAFPELEEDDDAAFLVGEDLYVAPVEEAGATSRSVLLPPGRWEHWWTGEVYEGPARYEVPAPLGEGPLFRREGSAVPMLRPSVRTLSPSDGSVDSWADDPGALWIRADVGGGFQLPSGEAMTSGGSTDQLGQQIVLVAGDTYRGWRLEYDPHDAWFSVEVDGASLPAGSEGCGECFWMDEQNRLVAELPAGDHSLYVRTDE